MGARVIALDIGDERLELAKEFGADELIDPGKNDVVEVIRDLTMARAHKSLDCSSSSEARRAAVQCVRTWGTACFVGEGGDVTIDVSNDMLRRQVTVVGSWTFSKNGQADCAEFVPSAASMSMPCSHTSSRLIRRSKRTNCSILRPRAKVFS